jgi:hypothetical protein
MALACACCDDVAKHFEPQRKSPSKSPCRSKTTPAEGHPTGEARKMDDQIYLVSYDFTDDRGMERSWPFEVNLP